MPRQLPRSGGWVLERRIPGTHARDAMGCYPLFVCQDWRALAADLDELDGLVSLSLVSDPFGDYDEDVLRRCFRDVLIPFKPHFVTDLSRPIDDIVSRHHRYYARRALDRVSVERCETPEAAPGRVDRALRPPDRAPSSDAASKPFRARRSQRSCAFRVIVMLRATCDGAAVGAHLWYRQGTWPRAIWPR